jgi:hypothetical protein
MRAAVEPRRRNAQPGDRGTIVDHQPRPQTLNQYENITRTIARSASLVTAGNGEGERCGYVALVGWRYGEATPFCDAPALPGSSYCARHRSLCIIAPGSAAAESAARALDQVASAAPAPPPELAFLDAAAVPELEAAAERDDIAACLDLPPGGGAASE